jgi:hypothetical protein
MSGGVGGAGVSPAPTRSEGGTTSPLPLPPLADPGALSPTSRARPSRRGRGPRRSPISDQASICERAGEPGSEVAELDSPRGSVDHVLTAGRAHRRFVMSPSKTDEPRGKRMPRGDGWSRRTRWPMPQWATCGHHRPMRRRVSSTSMSWSRRGRERVVPAVSPTADVESAAEALGTAATAAQPMTGAVDLDLAATRSQLLGRVALHRRMHRSRARAATTVSSRTASGSLEPSTRQPRPGRRRTTQRYTQRRLGSASISRTRSTSWSRELHLGALEKKVDPDQAKLMASVEGMLTALPSAVTDAVDRQERALMPEIEAGVLGDLIIVAPVPDVAAEGVFVWELFACGRRGDHRRPGRELRGRVRGDQRRAAHHLDSARAQER